MTESFSCLFRLGYVVLEHLQAKSFLTEVVNHFRSFTLPIGAVATPKRTWNVPQNKREMEKQTYAFPVELLQILVAEVKQDRRQSQHMLAAKFCAISRSHIHQHWEGFVSLKSRLDG
ncbi:hypothetical protein SO802_006217 [Lithocarpus litseifolius]|uniref:Uncharacterized protein n=1 Tax=Lithocarpus litseifolius TaxID=425828 RepID=A0AAW2DNN1_9ROSI